MLNKNNYTKLELEEIFAQNFGSPLFPELSNYYIEEGDLQRARKVCELGLKVLPNNMEGLHILAKIEILENQSIRAEHLLKEAHNNNKASIEMTELLVKIRDSLKRSKLETQKIINSLLIVAPDNSFAHHWNQKNNIFNDHTNTKKNNISKNNLTFKISHEMASLTFYKILKKQKYYLQAKLVLEASKKSEKISSNIYNKEIKIIRQLAN
jgi:hypothetical protein